MAHQRIELLSNSKLDFDKVKKFTDNNEMWQRYGEIIQQRREGKSVADREIKFAMSAIMIASLFNSWQRPGSVKNLKLSEFHAASKVDDVYCICI